MKTSTSVNSLPETKIPNLKIVLTRWLSEVTSFQQNYHCIDDYVRHQCKSMCLSSLEAVQYTNQCSLRSLVTLQTEMRNELKRLIANMDKNENDLVKLKAHTVQLNRLNQRAQIQLMLSRNSAS